MAKRAERRRQQKAAAKPDAGEAAQKPQEGQNMQVRTLAVLSDDVVAEFARLLTQKNPLRDLCMRDLHQIHRVQIGTQVQLAAILLHVLEPTDGSAPPEPSRIIRPGGVMR